MIMYRLRRSDERKGKKRRKERGKWRKGAIYTRFHFERTQCRADCTAHEENGFFFSLFFDDIHGVET
jgi:hypothetical protein